MGISRPRGFCLSEEEKVLDSRSMETTSSWRQLSSRQLLAVLVLAFPSSLQGTRPHGRPCWLRLGFGGFGSQLNKPMCSKAGVSRSRYQTPEQTDWQRCRKCSGAVQWVQGLACFCQHDGELRPLYLFFGEMGYWSIAASAESSWCV